MCAWNMTAQVRRRADCAHSPLGHAEENRVATLLLLLLLLFLLHLMTAKRSLCASNCRSFGSFCSVTS